jgi:uncharacterized membrane protein YhaH (DUF805 family)
VSRQQLTWLFFGFSGRIDRRVYALCGLLLYLARFFAVYRIYAAGEDQAAMTFWGGVFLIFMGISILSHIALTVKRLHDIDRPGWFAAFFFVGDILLVIALSIPNGTPGPNRYGERTNEPM